MVHHDLSTLQRQGKRRSWHVQPNQVCNERIIELLILPLRVPYEKTEGALPVSGVAGSISFRRACRKSRRSSCIVVLCLKKELVLSVHIWTEISSAASQKRPLVCLTIIPLCAKCEGHFSQEVLWWVSRHCLLAGTVVFWSEINRYANYLCGIS